MTLGFIKEPSRVLLAMKKRGFGAGRWNGFGGKVLPGETIEEAMKREAFEEVGIEIQDMEKRGIITFAFASEGASASNGDILEVHIFTIQSFKGKLKEGEEMKPQWYPYDQIPYDSMWADDKYWLPMFLEDKKFHGKFTFGEKDLIKDYTLQVVEEV